MNSYQITSIGHIISPYKEKFAVPRQPGLVQDGVGQLILHTPYNHPDAVRGLEQFSHLWLLFIFHQTAQQGWHPLVRPPRLGGNAKLGVFATRSTFRPNSIGMSLVELKDIIIEKQSVILQLGSLDLIDGTPIIDIKPYLPYAESIADATAGFAQYAPHEEMDILFSEDATQQLQYYSHQYPHLMRFITQVLQQDPRPAYKKSEQSDRVYAVHLLDFNIRWQVNGQQTLVLSIEPR
ncbi:TPA: tRNA (N6-threonylcarbamoyladenosine(37)-N6)-methyltransferase TrmO [Proteus mirabilis]|uniref:tRNA (N6-threonylcarbamoyladenosine(37)-N6)-methyltransferase TrmO n=1 Tax=Proteus mirabilis TaxID=584 RepID=UPI0029EF16F3|nr:tRNA (N6-threonylcarbamoyladenosine(37)-N6)-methyltransferase TrmO [Proteus mirabilis]